MKYREDCSPELYNLTEDPQEVANRVESNPEIASLLEKRLEAWLIESNAAVALPNSEFKTTP